MNKCINKIQNFNFWKQIYKKTSFLCTEPQKLSNFWGFFMTKLSKQKKIELYQEWKIKGMPLLVIARRENLNRTALGYAIKLIDRYGPAILDAPHQTYTKEFKEKAIKRHSLALNLLFSYH